jgi:hypothetical protein
MGSDTDYATLLWSRALWKTLKNRGDSACCGQPDILPKFQK